MEDNMRLTKKQKQEMINEFYNKHNIWSVNDIDRRHRGHFFSPSAMKFFNSRVIQDVFCGVNNCYFVTSERYDANSPRLFTLRKYDPSTDNFETVGDFQAYESKAVALSAALGAAFDESSEFINII